jgi:alkanesulfonate monooxygenase SsuD/methylene tetrahydromethanopterin reductase-like flavin-dependent oxidoreductase (luciferase family)
VRFGAHLPLIDFTGDGWAPGRLKAFAEAARDLGFDSISSNDHLVFQKPWLDGITALASVIDHSGDMKLCTTIAVPAIRHPNVLAKHAAAIDLLSGGRLVLGVGPGSSARDYALTSRNFDQRWKLLDSAVKVLRSQLKQRAPAHQNDDIFSTGEVMAPAPAHDIPIWIGSWGSEAGLRRVARLGDGWLASAYNTTAKKLAQDRHILDTELARQGKDAGSFPTSLATMWTYITDDRGERDERLAMIATMLNRPPEVLAPQILIGPAEECAAKLRAYAAAGVTEVFIWPVASEREQLERFMAQVTPLVTTITPHPRP